MPFGDMRGITKLILSADDYNFFIGMLACGLERGIEDFGYVTTRTIDDNTAEITGIYPFPEEVETPSGVERIKTFERCHSDIAEKSYYFREFLDTVSGRNEKVGFYYHTHAEIISDEEFRTMEMPTEFHEELYASKRTVNDDINRFLERGLSERRIELLKYTKRIGDIIVEKLPNGNANFMAFTPIKGPYDEFNIRHTHSVEISVPEYRIRFMSEI